MNRISGGHVRIPLHPNADVIDETWAVPLGGCVEAAIRDVGPTAHVGAIGGYGRTMIDTVFFMASDLDRSTDWYSAHLGFEVGPRYGDWQEMRVGGEVVFALHGADVVTPGDGVWVGFRVDDLDAAIDRLGEAGIEPTDKETTDTGYKRFRSFVDPDGNPFQLIELSS